MLVEREEQLSMLLSCSEVARGGSGRIIALGGEAGIGKSSLLQEFTRRSADQNSRIWGMCDALFTPRPLGPIHDIVQLLPDFGRDWKDDAGTKLFSRLLAYFSELEEPLTLIIEDVHWADIGTLDFIRFLGRRISLCPLLMVISFRDDELGRDHPLNRVLGDLPSNQLERMELQPLSLNAVQNMVSATQSEAKSLWRVTGGNPFFVSEILANKAQKKKMEVPESVQDAVHSRLSRLESSHRAFLISLSIIPVPIDPELHCHWMPEADHWLDQSVLQGILVETVDGKLRFRHELARLATSKRCSSIELRALHKQRLDIMLEETDKYSFAELMHHSKGATDAASVLHFAPLAAENAARLGAHREAADYLETALQYVDEASTENAAELYESWAYESGISNQVNDRVIEARRHALTLWRALKRPEKVAENLRFLSRLHWYHGEAAQAGRYLDESINLLEELGNQEKLALAYTMRSQMLMLNSQMTDAIKWAQRAIAEAADPASPEINVHALNNIGTAKLFLGQEDGVADLQESLRLALRHNMHEDAARVFTNLSEYSVDIRKLDLAEETLEQGITFDTEHDLDSWLYYLLGRKAQLRLEQGRLKEAAEICSAVIDIEGQTLLMKLPARIMLGRAQLRMGEAEAAKTLDAARADALATGEVQYQIPVLFGLLEKAWLSGSQAAAVDTLKTLEKIEPHLFSLWSRAEHAFWANLLDAPLPEQKESMPTAFDPALAGDMQKAGDAFAARGAAYLANICYAMIGEADVVSRALAALHGQGANAVISHLMQLAEARGVKRKELKVPRGPYEASRSNPVGLTAKEQSVLVLLGEGRSNAEIAETLSRSPRTIEHHVSSILQKMEAENRLAVILRLQKEPWLIDSQAG